MPGRAAFDIAGWLSAQGLQDYIAAFQDNHIDAETLAQLTAEDLRELGVGSIGHRRKLLAAIAGLSVPAQPAVASPIAVAREAAMAHAIPAQRRQVTTLFSDLVGFTALSNRFDAEVMDELLRSYADVCSQVIARHEGHIVKYLGDGVLVTFGYPRAQDDDAVRAVRASLELVDLIGRIPIPGGECLSARVGLATGLVIAGESAVERDSLVGESTNLAARLQAEAEPGQVLIAPTTASLIRGRFLCEPLGSRSLKGFDAPIHVTRVVSEDRVESRFEAARRQARIPIAGRRAEMTRLMERAALARDGQGQVVTIEGEAGIGKSRLIDEVTHHRDLADQRRLLLQTSPHDLGTPFYPVIKLIEFSAGLVASDTPDERFAKIAASTRRLTDAPEEWLALIAEMLGIVTAHRKLLSGFAPREIRLRTINMLLGLLSSIAGRGALIVFEDLQWADPSTRELLGMLVPRIATLPALLMVTRRPLTATEARPVWTGEKHVTRLSLERLAADELRTLISGVMGNAPLRPEVVEAIVERSDGVPIFAEELAYALLEGDRTTEKPALIIDTGTAPIAIPSTLTESLLARLDRLDHGRETAQLAAVIGREIAVALLMDVSPLGADAVRAAVEELIAVGILVRHETTAGEVVAFRQSLVRDSAYSLVLRRDRQRLHRQIAEAALARFPELVERRLDFVPRHLEASGDQQAAIAAWRQAGRSAARQSAVGEAVTHYTRALNICLAQPADDARDDLELAILTELCFPMLAMQGWTSLQAAAHVDRAVLLAARPASQHRIVPVLMAKWLTGFGTADRESLRAVAEQIAEIGRAGDVIDRLLVSRVLSSQYLFEGALDVSLREFRAFKALYNPEQHEAELGSGATNHAVTVDAGLATCLALMGQCEESQRVAATAITAAYAGGHYNTICQTLAAAGGFCALLHRDADAIAHHAAELAEISQRHDLPFWRPHADLLAGCAAALRGDATGLAQARKGIDAMIAGRAFVLSAWAMFYATSCNEAGEHDEVRRALAAAKPVIDGGERWFEAEYLRLQAALKLASGDRSAACADLQSAVSLARTQGAALFEARAAADLDGAMAP